MALIRLAFGNVLPCSPQTGEAACPAPVPTAIHRVRGPVTEFREPHLKPWGCGSGYTEQRVSCICLKAVHRKPAGRRVCPSVFRSARPMWWREAAAETVICGYFLAMSCCRAAGVSIWGPILGPISAAISVVLRRPEFAADRGTAAKMRPKMPENAVRPGQRKLCLGVEPRGGTAVESVSAGRSPPSPSPSITRR
jgi:hypothetical protein